MIEARIGCAGWSLPRAVLAEFPHDGSHLQRYAARLNCAEINSSFYRPHQRSTYARWADSVPEDFRFSVKLPRAITHDARLRGVAKELDAFLDQASALGERLGCLLVQLPPSFAFERGPVARFFAMLRRRHAGTVVLEPRHASWFVPDVDAVLARHRIGRVAADPALLPAAAHPGGDPACVYFRLHGSPRMYFSVYTEEWLRQLARRLRAARASAASCWCVFDNTAHGGAIPNALRIRSLLQKR
jgi:uncharacterized protein YecE (DUF72 family)